MNRSEAKTNAKQSLKGNWVYGIVTVVLYEILVSVATMLVGIGYLLFGIPLQIGEISVFDEGRKTKKFEIEKLFSGFSDGLGNRVLLSIMEMIFTFLWTLLLIVPGIIKAYSYKAAAYISYVHPEMTWNECLNKSKEVTKGHKWELFVFDLSFIGWYLLCILSFGIGFLWLLPYMRSAEVEFINANIYKLEK